jgi:hypothetical protein
MSCLTQAQEETVERIYKALGGNAPRVLIALLVRLSAPARTAIRLQLTQMKNTLQAQINSAVIRKFRAQVLETKVSATITAAALALNQSKNTINLIGVGVCATDDLNDPALQKFIKFFTGVNDSKLPALNFGGFDTLYATVDSLNYQLRRVQNAVDLSQNGLDALNSKLSILNEYITILDAI